MYFNLDKMIYRVFYNWELITLIMVFKRSNEIKSEPVDKAVSTEVEWLIDRRDGAKNFELRKFRIKAGGMIPKHYHQDIEHEQYVLKGEYEIGIDNNIYHVKPGDSLYVPARSVHWYKNDGKEDAEFLCIIPKKERYNVVYLDE